MRESISCVWYFVCSGIGIFFFNIPVRMWVLDLLAPIELFFFSVHIFVSHPLGLPSFLFVLQYIYILSTNPLAGLNFEVM